MKYKILVLDIDGTLTNSRKEVSDVTKAAIFGIMQKGVTVVIASGRPTQGVEPLARELKLDEYGGYILSFNGGRIMNCQTREVIYEQVMPKKMLSRLSDFGEAFECAMMSYDGNTVITKDPTDPFIMLEARINKLPVRKIEDFGDYDEVDVNKCIITGEGDYLATIEPKFQRVFGSRLNIYRSEPFFLELMPKNIDKAYSLSKLLEKLGLTKEEMVACGDGFNDSTMIKYAGLGVAMKNAQPIVKEVADFITKSNDEDGVAYVIEKFFV